jgi:hypothetical protein
VKLRFVPKDPGQLCHGDLVGLRRQGLAVRARGAVQRTPSRIGVFPANFFVLIALVDRRTRTSPSSQARKLTKVEACEGRQFRPRKLKHVLNKASAAEADDGIGLGVESMETGTST